MGGMKERRWYGWEGCRTGRDEERGEGVPVPQTLEQHYLLRLILVISTFTGQSITNKFTSSKNNGSVVPCPTTLSDTPMSHLETLGVPRGRSSLRRMQMLTLDHLSVRR